VSVARARRLTWGDMSTASVDDVGKYIRVADCVDKFTLDTCTSLVTHGPVGSRDSNAAAAAAAVFNEPLNCKPQSVINVHDLCDFEWQQHTRSDWLYTAAAASSAAAAAATATVPMGSHSLNPPFGMSLCMHVVRATHCEYCNQIHDVKKKPVTNYKFVNIYYSETVPQILLIFDSWIRQLVIKLRRLKACFILTASDVIIVIQSFPFWRHFNFKTYSIFCGTRVRGFDYVVIRRRKRRARISQWTRSWTVW